MRSILFCVTGILLFLNNVTLYELPQTQSVRKYPTTICERKFQPYLRKRAYCKVLLNGNPQKKKLKSKCRKDIEPYFKSNVEQKEVVKKYAELCKEKMDPDWSRCTDIILYFNSPKLGWNMYTVPTLFKIYDKVNFLTDENLKKITLTESDIHKFENARIYLTHCTDKLKESYEPFMYIVNYFMELRTQRIINRQKTLFACGCETLASIYELYRRRKIYEYLSRLNEGGKNTEGALPEYLASFVMADLDGKGKDDIWKKLLDDPSLPIVFGDTDKSELKDLLEVICFENENSSTKYAWSKERVQQLAENIKLINFKRLKSFMTIGYDICIHGTWFERRDPNSHWPVGFLLSHIESKGEMNEELIGDIARVMRWTFSPDTYTEYLDMISKISGFNNLDCKMMILKAVMDEADWKGIQDKKGYWRYKTDKHEFNEHLKLIIDLYVNPKGENICHEFASELASIEILFYLTKWTDTHMNALLKIASKSGMNIYEFRDCLRFSKDFEESTDKLKAAVKNKSFETDSVPTESEQEDFRKKLFSNKDKAKELYDPEKRKFKLDDFDDVLKIYKDVKFWDVVTI